MSMIKKYLKKNIDLQKKDRKLSMIRDYYNSITMENKKIINFLHNTPNQLTKFRTKKQVEINDDARGTYNTNSQITFKTSMLKSSLCDYSDAQILVSGTISVEYTSAAVQQQIIPIER